MVLLQIDEGAQQIGSVVNQLSDSSVKLAEAAANFGALKVIFGVFLVFMIIIMVAFFWQLFATQKKVGDIHASTKKVEKFLENSASRSLGKEQASLLIRRAFSDLSQTVKYTILRTRLENHIENQQEFVKGKVSRLITYEYTELCSFLANFECDGGSLSNLIKLEDSKVITDFILEQIYLGSDMFSVSSMDQASDILVNGIRIEALGKVS